MTQLFAVDVSPLGTEERKAGAKPSADRARTLKRAAMLANGQHPTGFGSIDPAHTCKECAHSIQVGGGRRNYWKCNLRPITGGPGSDIRLSWPACPKFEAAA